MPSLDTILRSIKGEIIKLGFKTGLLSTNRQPLAKPESERPQLIVSLTSYGRRVANVAPYAIMSMMRQTYLPDKIVLWLDNVNWNDGNLPNRLKALQQKGLTIRYCDDLRSYKKLVPALSEYPDDLIFTVDDDIYYPKDTLQIVMKEYHRNPNRIYGIRGYIPEIGSDGHIKPYNTWKLFTTERIGLNLFLTGGAGCLYQRKLLHHDVVNSDIFMKKCPLADDIWFFFMEQLIATERKIVKTSHRDIIPIDAFYQHFHRGASLAQTNCGQDQNDTQIANLMEHYGLTDKNIINHKQ